jgi:hypothetical protein
VIVKFLSGFHGDELPSSLDPSETTDHVRKLWWAMWSPVLGNMEFTKERIERLERLASFVEQRRQEALYVEPDMSPFICPEGSDERRGGTPYSWFRQNALGSGASRLPRTDRRSAA